MKKLTIYAIVVILSVLVFHSCNEPITEEPAGDELSLKSAPNVKTYIVVLNDPGLNAELMLQNDYEGKKKSAKSAAEKILKRAGITDGEIEFAYGTAIKGFSVKIPPGQLKKLQDDPSVQNIEEDQVISLIFPDANTKGKPAPPPSTSQVTPWGITRVGGAANGVGKTAWVIDTGIDLDHPDLNVDKNRSVTYIARSTPDDQNGHGTHVAGTIAAINNNIGVVGVAAGATVVSVKVLDRNGSGTTSGVIAGVDYVAAKAAGSDVANMSLGGGVSTTLDNAVVTASSKCKFVLAAGNESDHANNHSPARANGPNIYTISAMLEGGTWASFSNYGNPPVDYCAPGVYILSTYKGGGYETLHGTSMAAPHAAGVLLLGSPKTSGYVSGDPDGNPDPVISR